MKLILREHVQFPSSFSIIGHFLTKEILKRNWDHYVNLITGDDPGPFSKLEYEYLLKNRINDEETARLAPDNLMLTISTTPYNRPLPNKQLLYTAWEGTRIPEYYKQTVKDIDMILVPSNYTKNAFLQSQIGHKVQTVYHGVDTDVLPIQNPNGKFTFISIGIDDWRKNHSKLVEAYRREFDPKEAVLRIKTNARVLCPMGVTLDSSSIPFSRMGDMYNGHAYVSATRGEGFCFPALEALASWLPVIITKATGHTEFLGDDYFPVDIEKTVSRNGQSNQIKYAEPSIKSLREQMRFVYDNYDYCRKRISKGTSRVRTQFTWANTLDTIQDILEEYNVSF